MPSAPIVLPDFPCTIRTSVRNWTPRAFLEAHRGRVDVVTMSLWRNDANAFVASCNGDVQCVADLVEAVL